MNRTSSCRALVLKTFTTGESNRDAWFLTDDAGLVRATVFGGPKSRLRSHVSPFNSGTLWLYHDPVKNSRKVSDFDVASWRPGLRELWERSMAASALVETVLSSQGGGGGWKAALGCACESLDALERSDAETCERIFIHFLWAWPEILGLRPDLSRCSVCGKECADQIEIIWYDQNEGGTLCAACAGRDAEYDAAPRLLPLHSGARRWLEAAEKAGPAELRRLGLDKTSLAEARALTFAVMAAALGRRPSSWDNI